MNKQAAIIILKDFQEAKELKAAAEKRYQTLRSEILEDMKAGKYGDMVLDFEEREVKEYTVAARTDKIIKVSRVNK